MKPSDTNEKPFEVNELPLEVNSLIDARTIAESSYIADSRSTVHNVIVKNVNMVERGDLDKDRIKISEVLVGDRNLRKLKTSTRMDVFKFFNTELTNFINRKLRNTVSDKAIKRGILRSNPPGFDHYSDQYDDISKMAVSRSSYIEKAIASFDTRVLTAGDNIAYEEIPDDVLALESGTDIDFMYTEFVNLPEHNNVTKTKSVLVGKELAINNDIVITTRPNSNNAYHVVTKELVVATNDTFYIIDRTVNDNLTLRELDILEFNLLTIK